MSRLASGPLFLPENNVPRPALDEAKMRLKLLAAGVAESKHAEIISDLQSAMESYCVYRLKQQKSATPEQVRKYAERLKAALIQLDAAWGPDPESAAEAASNAFYTLLLEQVTEDGPVAAEAGNLLDLSEQLDDAIAVIDHIASNIAGSTDELSGKVEKANRQRQLAAYFMFLASKHGFPDDFRENGLMCQLFRECLRAVGETQTNPRRVFSTAAASLDHDVVDATGQFTRVGAFELYGL